MLTLESANDALEALYETYKEKGRELFASFEGVGEPAVLKADTDLIALAGSEQVLYIIEGYFRLMYGGKVVRLYSENDFISAQHQVEGVRIASEFASEVVLLRWTDVQRLLADRPALLVGWHQLLDLENKINLGLCAQLVDERVQPSLELRQFKADEVIIREETEALEIYEMISGEATVTVAGKKVGEIGTGEIFGEMSFLAECHRTATVTAACQCCVRVVKKEDFVSLIEVDRHLSASIAKTLAGRVIELNRRLAGR